MLSRARAANVRAAIVTGTCVRTSEAAARLVDSQAASYPLFFTAGVHPHNAKVCIRVVGSSGRVVGSGASHADPWVLPAQEEGGSPLVQEWPGPTC